MVFTKVFFYVRTFRKRFFVVCTFRFFFVFPIIYGTRLITICQLFISTFIFLLPPPTQETTILMFWSHSPSEALTLTRRCIYSSDIQKTYVGGRSPCGSSKRKPPSLFFRRTVIINLTQRSQRC